MNVAVCDDQLDYLNLIQKKIIECFHEPEMELNVYTFSTIQDMLNSTRFRCYEFAFIEMKVENDRGIAVSYTHLLLRMKRNIVMDVLWIYEMSWKE